MKKILIIGIVSVLIVAMTACKNQVNKESQETTTVVKKQNITEQNTVEKGEKVNIKARGKIVATLSTDSGDYWIVETRKGKTIGFVCDSNTNITWKEDLEIDTCNIERKIDVLNWAEEIEITLTQELNLSEKQLEEVNEDEAKQWYIAGDVHITKIEQYADTVSKKPVIYLYPEKTMDVNVQLKYNGKLTVTYPEHKKTGWDVSAKPDGTLTDLDTGKEYSYLFWEGDTNVNYDMSDGFVVAGEDIAEFLQEKLSYMGLTPKEYNEFIVFWLPEMKNNKYNLIKFQETDYTDNAKLIINPKPDSILRVFMTWKALDEKIEIPEQKLSTFKRKGFTVIEWGGSEIK